MRSLIFLLIMLLFASTLISGIVYAFDHNQVRNNHYIEVRVQHGDTLWTIAKPFYKEKGDFRELVYNIKKANNLKTSIIYPGQVIKIPIM